jgi:hypothetical protein
MFLQETLSKLDGNQGFLLVLWVAYRCFAYPSPVVTLKAMSKNCIPQKNDEQPLEFGVSVFNQTRLVLSVCLKISKTPKSHS